MLCEKCYNKNATVFKKIENGNEMYICEDCLQEIEELQNLKICLTTNDDQKKCLCNTTFLEINESGILGCKHCYQTFKDDLTPIISKIHLGEQHFGKRPMSKIEKLEKQIDDAMKNKFYDLAVKLNHELEVLKEGNNV